MRTLWIGPLWLAVCWGNWPTVGLQQRGRCIALSIGSVSFGIGLAIN